MSFLLNRCKFTTATTGTGTITVGSAVSGFRAPATAGAVDGREYTLFILDGSDFEQSIGVSGSSGTTFTRTLIESSTGSLLNLSGSATVIITPSADDLNLDDAFRRRSIFGTPVISGTTGGVITTDANGDNTVNSSITLTSDAYLRNLTIGASGVITTSGYRIFVAGTLDISAATTATGCIVWNGNNGNTATTQAGGTAGAALTGVTVGGSVAGTAGGTATTTTGGNSTGPTASANQIGGNNGQQGAGGTGSSGAGGGSQSASGTAVASRAFPQRIVTDLLRGVALLQGGQGGRGGAGGGQDGTATEGGGGGGGSGGGVIAIFARNIVIGSNTTAGMIRALGGNGGAGDSCAAGNKGGGAGGSGAGGGAIIIVAERITGGSGVAWVWADGGSGGNGGTGFGTGTNGAGSQGGEGGVIISHVLSTGVSQRILGATGSVASGTTGGAGGQSRWTL